MTFRPEVVAVRESPLVQLATVAESLPGALKLCYGESDMPTPEFICRAAWDASRSGHTFYTHTAGSLDFREAVAAKVFELHGIGYRPSEIMGSVGASAAIYTAIRATVGPGDNAVIITPGYAIFDNGVIMAGAQPRPVPLALTGNRFVLDLDRVRAAIDRDTRLLIVNSPSNPTGWVMSVEEQVALYDLATAHDLVLLADEVYDRLTYTQPIAPSFARIAENRDRVIVVNSFSKTYNMTGWRLGWAQSSERVIRLLYKAAEFITSNPPAMVQQAGMVALRDGESYVQELRSHYAARRRQVMEALGTMAGVTLPAIDGAFYAFPRIEGMTDSTAFTARLLRETGVALAPGVAFGSAGEGAIRLCFASTEATVAEALARLTRFVASSAA